MGPRCRRNCQRKTLPRLIQRKNKIPNVQSVFDMVLLLFHVLRPTFDVPVLVQDRIQTIQRHVLGVIWRASNCCNLIHSSRNKIHRPKKPSSLLLSIRSYHFCDELLLILFRLRVFSSLWSQQTFHEGSFISCLRLHFGSLSNPCKSQWLRVGKCLWSFWKLCHAVCLLSAFTYFSRAPNFEFYSLWSGRFFDFLQIAF